eukprot:TRINITY_DN1610_c1_g1_i2.p1 TRINITY_DN1610_c1_g1~~TRINITY_DN1610_c1_g1_i2.p1  ORF type:complete len:190 (+),score=72.98 TRINITY_DN1610_c1_g1_i2:57-572(+)
MCKAPSIDVKTTQVMDADKKAIAVIANLLEDVIQKSEKKPKQSSHYDGEKVPGIEVREYMKRLVRYTGCDVDTIIIAIIYIDRICINAGIAITGNNVHRLLLAGFVVAIKWRQDRVHGNGHYATVGGVTRQELNRLERTALNDLKWETHVEKSAHNKYCKQFTMHKLWKAI